MGKPHPDSCRCEACVALAHWDSHDWTREEKLARLSAAVVEAAVAKRLARIAALEDPDDDNTEQHVSTITRLDEAEDTALDALIAARKEAPHA